MRYALSFALLVTLTELDLSAQAPSSTTQSPGSSPLQSAGPIAESQSGMASGEAAPLSDRAAVEVVVFGRADSLIGEALSASQGKVGTEEISRRPILRTGEILETIPGVIISQHSGSGKANQYYLRGFNLDHGTDFSTSLDGMPINFPTHAHGQGYTDLNFIIPELLDEVEYLKGPYYAEVGDFSAAGAAKLKLIDALPKGIAKVTLGENEYVRGLVADSAALGTSDLLYAVEGNYYNGPWDLHENMRKYNALLRFTSADGISITATAYHNEWQSTDQIPRRAVEQSLISDLGTIDPSDAGRSARYNLLGNWGEKDKESSSSLGAFLYYYRLDLYSNFTYFLDDPVNGDQFEQVDRRVGMGGQGSHEWQGDFLSTPSTTTLGFQVRNDIIPRVELNKTKNREVLRTVRSDDVIQTNAALYAQNEMRWAPKVRTTLGLRGDAYHFDVSSSVDENSGNETDGIVSPKFGIVIGPWSDTEFYGNAGYGFHSNDARGSTITVDPNDPASPAEQVDPLVRAKGAEIGVRTAALENLTSTLSLWLLTVDSELLFVGDAGSTEASRPSRRAGVEWANFYTPTTWLTIDADLSVSRSRFSGDVSEGTHIPGAIASVVATGVTIDLGEGFYGSLRYRYFGPRPLIEDNSAKSSSTSLFNGRFGYKVYNFDVSLEGFNLFDRGDSDIDYFYASRLPGEPAGGVEDYHFHPVEPRTFRLTVSWNF